MTPEETARWAEAQRTGYLTIPIFNSDDEALQKYLEWRSSIRRPAVIVQQDLAIVIFDLTTAGPGLSIRERARLRKRAQRLPYDRLGVAVEITRIVLYLYSMERVDEVITAVWDLLVKVSRTEGYGNLTVPGEEYRLNAPAKAYLQKVRTGPREYCWDWVILECPHCRGVHVHGGIPIDDDPMQYLGHRFAHCPGHKPWTGYVLEYAGRLPFYDRLSGEKPRLSPVLLAQKRKPDPPTGEENIEDTP